MVAEIIVQSENAPQISEALKVLSLWNPTSKPLNFMTDYSDAEITAIEDVFPECKTYLYDFHREQCWVKDKKHGLSEADAEQLLSLLRKCAHAQPNLTTPSDHSYKQEVENLKQSYIWKRNQQVRECLQTKWLTIPEVIIIISIIIHYYTVQMVHTVCY